MLGFVPLSVNSRKLVRPLTPNCEEEIHFLIGQWTKLISDLCLCQSPTSSFSYSYNHVNNQHTPNNIRYIKSAGLKKKTPKKPLTSDMNNWERLNLSIHVDYLEICYIFQQKCTPSTLMKKGDRTEPPLLTTCTLYQRLISLCFNSFFSFLKAKHW